MTAKMKLDESVRQMECSNGYHPRYGNGGGRSPSPLTSSIMMVNLTLVGFDLLAALAHHGLLDTHSEKSLMTQAEEKWGKSVDLFLRDLEKYKITRQSICSRSFGNKRVMIGWAYDAIQKKNSHQVTLCRDVEFTLAVLSRCVNQIFFQNREPDLNWDTFFHQTMVVDEDLSNLIRYAK